MGGGAEITEKSKSGCCCNMIVLFLVSNSVTSSLLFCVSACLLLQQKEFSKTFLNLFSSLGSVKLKKQKKEEGKSSFFIHPKLVQLLYQQYSCSVVNLKLVCG